MADILVQMNMPNSCVECSSTGLSVAVSILGASCPWCREIIDPKVNLRVARHEDCPLRKLPEHEDLIEKQTVLAALHSDYAYAAMGIIEKEVPVIVPSNKEVNKHE